MSKCIIGDTSFIYALIDSISSALKFVNIAALSVENFSVALGIAMTGILALLVIKEVLLPKITDFPLPAPVVPNTIKTNVGATAYSGNTSVSKRETHSVSICKAEYSCSNEDFNS